MSPLLVDTYLDFPLFRVVRPYIDKVTLADNDAPGSENYDDIQVSCQYIGVYKEKRRE